MAYAAVGAQQPIPVRVVPPPSPPGDPWVQNAGYQRRGDSTPVYRWVPPVAFNDPEVSKSRAWGQSRFGPAYRSSASRECPECMQGLGAYYQARANWPIPLSGVVADVAPYVGIAAVLGLGIWYYRSLPM